MMNPALPKRLAAYVHDTGIRALDHLANTVPPPAAGAQPDALQALVGSWHGMTTEQKETFVGSIASAVGEVIVASALLPVGIKAGKQAVKSARKVLKRSARTLKRKAKVAAEAKKKAKAMKR